MTSTLKTHLQQLKFTPQNLQLFSKILEQFIALCSSSSSSFQDEGSVNGNDDEEKIFEEKYQACQIAKEIVEIVGKMLGKIWMDGLKRKNTVKKDEDGEVRKFLYNFCEKFLEIIIVGFLTPQPIEASEIQKENEDKVFEYHFERDGQENNQWIQVIDKLVQICQSVENNRIQNQEKLIKNQKIIHHVIQHIFDGAILNGNNANLLFKIFTHLNSNLPLIGKNPLPILSFLVSIPSFASLSCPQDPNLRPSQSPKTSLFQKRFKAAYQQLFLETLVHLPLLSIKTQVLFYSKLGQKIFSKFANPLILAQFLMGKLEERSGKQEDPEVQIQVLAALFILVGKYGLQLSKYYQILQKILSKKRSSYLSLFKQSNSNRFLKLIETSMRSSKVPFSNIKSLSHKLFHLILEQKTQQILWFLSFFFNLVKKHRQLQNIFEQFLQLQTLQYHWLPQIRSLSRQMRKKLDKEQYMDINLFVKVDLRKECRKKIKEIRRKIQGKGENEEHGEQNDRRRGLKDVGFRVKITKKFDLL